MLGFLMTNKRLCQQLLLLPLMALLPLTSYACRCAQLNLADYFAGADVVVRASVTDVSLAGSRQLSSSINAQLDVLEIFKGSLGSSRDFLRINTGGSSAACGIGFQLNQEYLIFAYLETTNGQLWATTCNGSRLVGSDFQDVSADQVLNELQRLVATDLNMSVPDSSQSCSQQVRNSHGPALIEIWDKISISRQQWTQQQRNIQISDAIFSPNSAYSFTIANPTAFQRPPHITTLSIDNERDYQLQIALHGVQSAVVPSWVNEKLLLLRVDWSGDLVTDIIFDVEKEEYVYHEAVYSGAEWQC